MPSERCGVLRAGAAGLTVLALAALGLAGYAPAPSGFATKPGSGPPAAAPPALVFDGVTVVDVETGNLLPNQRVVVAGTRIQAVGSDRSVPLPKGAKVIGARGKYLIPGLWDMHTHPQAMVDYFYPMLVANGVTGIRDPGTMVPLDRLRQWRREILAGTRVGPPRLIFSGPVIMELTGSTCTLVVVCFTPGDTAAARRLADSLVAAGSDMIKTYHLSKDMYFVIAAEARRRGVPFGGHLALIPTDTRYWSVMQASDSGARLVDHLVTSGGLDTLCLWAPDQLKLGSAERCRPVVERLRRNGTWWEPTLHQTIAMPRSAPLAARFSKRAREFWAGARLSGNWLRDSAVAAAVHLRVGAGADSLGMLSILRRVGGAPLLLAGRDITPFPELGSQPPGFSLHVTLTTFVVEGLTPLEALRTATLNPAQMWRATDSLGTVAPGKLADLVLLDADPLADITNTTMIRAVVANGRYFDRAALDRLLGEIQTKARQEHAVAVAAVTGQKVAVLPVRAVTNFPATPPQDSAAWGAWADATRRPALVDSLLGAALVQRAPSVFWVLPATLRALARRTPGLVPNPEDLNSLAIKASEEPGSDYPGPLPPLGTVQLDAALQRLVTAGGGQAVLVPELVTFSPAANGVQADLRLRLINVRTGQVLWRPRYAAWVPLTSARGATPAAAFAAALALAFP